MSPVALVALGGLLLNDHVLKAAAVGTAWSVVTGKLSDFCGVAFLPILIVALLELARRAAGRVPAVVDVRAAVVVAVAVGAAFALMKSWSPAGAAYAHTLGVLQWPFYALRALTEGAPVPSPRAVRHVVDVTDVVAVPAAFVVVPLQRRRVR